VTSTVWVLGRVTGPPAWAATPPGRIVLAWEVCGIFTTREKAVEVNRGPAFFVGPVPVDQHLPTETVEWPGVQWPWDVRSSPCPIEPGHLATPKPHGP
jgi:hypothetical protein